MKYRTQKVAAIVIVSVFALAFALTDLSASGSSQETQPRRSSKAKPRSEPVVSVQSAPVKFSKFNHSIPQHKQDCASCHKFPTKNWKQVRKGDEAFPDVTDYPEHASCVGCHRQQFFKGAQPVICTICHENPGPTRPERHPFPNPTDAFDKSKAGQMAVSEFGINFPHDKHIDIVGQLDPSERKQTGVRFLTASFETSITRLVEDSDPKSCSVCHQTYQPQGETDDEFVTRPPKDLAEDGFWLKKGTFKTSPSSHATCFNCHSEDGGLTPAPKDCNTCHKLLPQAQQLKLTTAHDEFDPRLAATMGITDKTLLEKWSQRDTAKYRHEWLPHAGLSCTACHTVTRMNTLDPSTMKVQVKSCGGEGTGCHIEANTDGVLNLEIQKKKAEANFQCTKCHVFNGKLALPESHLSALPKK